MGTDVFHASNISTIHIANSRLPICGMSLALIMFTIILNQHLLERSVEYMDCKCSLLFISVF